MPTVRSQIISLAIAVFAATSVSAETHTINFVNNCGRGYPVLYGEGGALLSTGANYVSNGPIIGAIAFLQTGSCGQNGEGCTMVETTLKNGAGTTSTDITLIPPHEFSVTTGFGYWNGCDGAGADCTNANCPTAFHEPDQTWVQVGCSVDNVNLAITFCD